MRNIDGNAGTGTGSASLDHTASIENAKAGEQTPSDEIYGVSKHDLNQLWTWNEQVPPLITRCMHDIFVEQAQAHPDDVAVQSWDGQLTYSELETLSSRLAHHLISKGVEIGTRIPLCFEKSMWAIVALLGVMRSGATFSLTDPSQPEARLRTIVEQTEARLVLTSAAQADLGSKVACGGEVMAITRSFIDSLPSESLAPLPEVPSTTPMYIIFTSGSTGKPKGVVISHENYTSGAIPRGEAVGYKSSSRCFDFPSYAFDVSIDCMLCTLAVGGRVCVPSEEDRMNNLSGAIRDSKANMVHMTPSVARVLDSDIIPSLDVLGLGGEAVSSSDAAAWSKTTNLAIAYGPSECTVGCTINNTLHVSTGIGVGVGGVTWIVDPEDHDRLTPVGGVGELIIEGPVVGVGYLGEPAKPAEVFIDDPKWLLAGHGPVPGRNGRLYKTGDLVRYEPNGTGSIEFIGRKDQQVKLRGQRVELAEVEHHLQACLPQGVRVAAEVIKPDYGAPTLVAFLSETQGTKSEELFTEPSEELGAALAAIDSTMGARVPRYMVPAAFITLSNMPTLVSRKIDRKELRKIGAELPREKLSSMQAAEVDEAEADTETEQQLQRAWSKVLGPGAKIYKRSNFFHLGGDSLRAMKLISAARDEGLVLTVANVFTYPSLCDMALKATAMSDAGPVDIAPFSLLEQGWTGEDACRDVSKLCNIDAESVEDVYPCTPLQEALMALSAKVKEAYVAQRVVKLDSMATADKLINAFDMAQADCPILRTRIVQVSSRGLVQVVVKGKLQWFSGNDLESYLVSDRDEDMDLGKPLVRYAVINDEKSGQVSFVLTMHHALYDGWAMPVVVDRVNKAYNGEKVTRAAEFKHFIKYLLSQKKDDSAAYWREQLAGANGPQFPALPYVGYQTKADSLLEVYVPLGHQPASNATVATLIRAAWALVASQYIKTGDVIFGETLTGRNAPIMGAEEIEGPMITTVPVRVQVDESASVSELLQDIQEQTVSQIPHEHFGLQHIRRLSPDALEACELRTGLVLHPSTEEEPLPDDLPANRLVPAGDAEAAQEALKFNTYALMLVCSIDPKGFLVMASFDSNTVDMSTMESALEQFKQVSISLCEKTLTSVGDITRLTSADVEKIHRVAWNGDLTAITTECNSVQAAYLVDSAESNRLVPIGGVGELIVESSSTLELPELPKPVWSGEIGDGRFYKTGKLAKYTKDGKLNLVGNANVKTDALVGTTQAPKKRVSATSRKQRKLRNLWSRVLQAQEEDIGLNDNFFLLGGDSIAAMKLTSEARLESIGLTVAQVFQNRSLFDMANIMTEEAPDVQTVEEAPPFSLLGLENTTLEEFTQDVVRPQLASQEWKVANVLPTRPLQQISVVGTVTRPKFSVRYELMYFDGVIDKVKLEKSCHEVVSRNEILRTAFIEHQGEGYAVVLENFLTEFVEYETDDSVESFTRKLLQLDVETRMTLGSAFVKWFLVRGPEGKSCLAMRISHAQYDEICLPLILHQLSALYQDQSVQDTVPFSSYVAHVVRRSVPSSIPYWKDLLAGSTMSILAPTEPITDTKHFCVEKTVDISSRPRDVTVATIPTAAWALCLARRLGSRDVLFGEVVSGRNIDFPNADAVMGPCWQYVPVRVPFRDGWTAADLLGFVQAQHVASAAHEAVSLPELVRHCTDWPASGPPATPLLRSSGNVDDWWFDTVVHQDVAHVEDMGVRGVASRMETVYLHEERLREWKCQAFVRGDKMTVEIVTVESWGAYAAGLLDDLVDCVAALVSDQGKVLLPAAEAAE